MSFKALKTGRIKGAKSYFFIDNSNSPVPLSYVMPDNTILVIPSGERVEFASMTCAHCQVVVLLNPGRKRAREYCKRCNQYICGRLGCTNTCTPIDEMIDLAFSHTTEAPLLDRPGVDAKLQFDEKLLDRFKIF